MYMGNEAFSVYNLRHGTAIIDQAGHPLPDLVGDQESGWAVARNLKKPLNHLAFLKRKEEIARNLVLHNSDSPTPIFDENYELLKLHQQRRISTNDTIVHLCQNLKKSGISLSEDSLIALLREYATIRHMEFHPSDVCNLSCTGCTYGHAHPETKPLPVNFPYRSLVTVAQIQPRSIVICGGGEPALYAQGAFRFQELVDEITTQIPGIALALITNGTYKPAGNWPNKLDWIRLSVDAATEQTYTAFRGKSHFHNVISNFLKYLDHDIRYVGISFLFARQNIHEYASIADFIFQLVKREKPQHMHKVNIQYRPLRQDPRDDARPFQEAVSPQQIQNAVNEIRALADSSTEMKEFLRNQTNVTAILGGNSHPPYAFSRCYYCQAFKIVRANGDLRPCFIRVVEPDFWLGNILRDALETIALNTLYVSAIQRSTCNPNSCRQCHVNYIFEQGLLKNIQPSNSPEVLADPMF